MFSVCDRCPGIESDVTSVRKADTALSGNARERDRLVSIRFIYIVTEYRNDCNSRAAAIPATMRTNREENKFAPRSAARRLLSSNQALFMSKSGVSASTISFHIFKNLRYSASFPGTANHSANSFSCSGELLSLKCPANTFTISVGMRVFIIT